MYTCFECDMEIEGLDAFIKHLEEGRHEEWKTTSCSSQSQEEWLERCLYMTLSIASGLLSAIASAKKERNNG